jgi:4-hydroxybenzoate polyprenyltransferase
MDTMFLKCATFEPMWQRLKRQEGALLGIVVSMLFFAGQSLGNIASLSALTLVALSTLYFFNDLTDCAEDLNNPRKDQPYIETLNNHRVSLWTVLVIQKAAVLLVTLLIFGPELTVVVGAIFGINVAYSLKVKGIPGLDVFWVGIWGAAIAGLGGIHHPWETYAIVGVMTAISHIYQVRIDAPVDQAHHVQTSAVVSHRMTEIQILALCASLALLIGSSTFVWLGITAFIPWFLGKYLNSSRSWVFARYYFGIIWLCHLESTYGRLATF